MVFAALAPAVSGLLASQAGATWVDICSASGPGQVANEAGERPRPDAPGEADRHCGYCLTQAHTPVLPTHALGWALPSFSSERLSLSGAPAAVFKPAVQNANRSRAPPLFA
jgi:Protein of unknown function (DUF2946)